MTRYRFNLLICALAAVLSAACKEKPVVIEPGQGFTSFSFLMEHNPSLSADVTCTVNEDGTITGTFTDILKSYILIPSFELDCEQATVGAVVQTSGKDKHDFSKSVSYEVKMNDGTYRTFIVKMGIPKVPKLPVIRINTENAYPILDKKNYIPGTVVIEDPDGAYWDTPRLEVKIVENGVRGRGNSTWDMPKKPYKIKFDEKISIFGLGEDKEWVLLANYADKTLLRNVVAMKLSEIVGMEWTPSMLPVEVYLNDEYMGCYTFSEHKKVSKHRVDLDIVGESDNSGDAVTGDYYMEIEQNLDETTCFRTSICGIPMMFSDPEVPTAAQYDYIVGYFYDAENALMGNNFTDPDNGWQKYIDIESFAKAYIVNELTKNIDGNMRKSSFITKEKGKKLEMYHLWDYDLTLGNCNYLDDEFGATDGPEGWFIKDFSCNYWTHGWNHTNWYTRLTDDPAFCAKVKEIWDKHHQELSSIPDFIDVKAMIMEDAQKRNFKRWDILNTSVWPNVVVKGTYAGEVEYLKDYYTKRFRWLDGKFNVGNGEIFK
ncbi:MAG: CotH kinase family protein [Bacteroidales bacterium]|nr:CotH kinase family protein [Bacteroidales bacterium]